MRWTWSVAAAVVLAGCPAPYDVPGREVMGRYLLHAESVSRNCQLDEVTGEGFEFDTTFSRNPDTGEAWATLRGYPRAASWDGQILISAGEAQRVFGSPCADCAMRLEEVMKVAILSRSQSTAVGDVCPPDVFDGGVPTPDFDRGITGPGPTSLGYDAVRACGELSTVTRAGTTQDGGACAAGCGGCAVRYLLSGERR